MSEATRDLHDLVEKMANNPQPGVHLTVQAYRLLEALDAETLERVLTSGSLNGKHFMSEVASPQRRPLHAAVIEAIKEYKIAEEALRGNTRSNPK